MLQLIQGEPLDTNWLESLGQDITPIELRFNEPEQKTLAQLEAEYEEPERWDGLS